MPMYVCQLYLGRKCTHLRGEVKSDVLFFSESLPLLEVERTRSSLGDESGLGEEATFLFFGLAVDGDLDGHLGCVLRNAVSNA